MSNLVARFLRWLRLEKEPTSTEADESKRETL